MKWHDVLKESPSPDSFKENYLCVLCASSAAGGEFDQALSGLIPYFSFCWWSSIKKCLQILPVARWLSAKTFHNLGGEARKEVG